MYEIQWTKEYQLTFDDRFAKVFISQHADGMFYGGVLYYNKTGSFTDTTMTLHMKLQNFMGGTEDYVFSLCMNWIRKNFGSDFDISEPEITKP